MVKYRIPTRQEIFDALRKKNAVLKKYSVRKIGLFGSHVRDEGKKKSDIDFLVDFENPTFDNLMGLYDELQNLFKRKIELITEGSLSKYIQPYVAKEVQWYEVE